MAINNPLIPGDPFSYDLKWLVRKINNHTASIQALQSDLDAVEQRLSEYDNLYQYITEAVALGHMAYVTPELFGAAGDGTTDDTEAFQRAVNSGFPVVAENSYNVGTIVLKDNSAILGGTYTSSSWPLFQIYDVSNVLLDHITADMEDAEINLQGCCIDVQEAERVTVKNCRLSNIPGNGIRFYHSNYCVADGNYVTKYYYGGITCVQGTCHAWITNNEVIDGVGRYPSPTINCYPISLAGYGIPDDLPQAEYIYCLNNTIIDSMPLWEGIEAHCVKNAIIAGNVIKGTLQGIVLTPVTTQAVTPPETDNVIICNNVIEFTASATVTSPKTNYGVLVSWRNATETDPEDQWSGGTVSVYGNTIKNVGLNQEGAPAAFYVAGVLADIHDNIVENCYGDVLDFRTPYRECHFYNNKVIGQKDMPSGSYYFTRYRANEPHAFLYVHDNIFDADGSNMINYLGPTGVTPTIIWRNNESNASYTNIRTARADVGTVAPTQTSLVAYKGDMYTDLSTGLKYTCTTEGSPGGTAAYAVFTQL